VEGQASAASSSSAAPSSSASSSSAAPSSSAAAESTGALDGAQDLSAGLLTAEAFGPGAQVTPVTADQIAQQAQLGGLGGAQDLTITPEACAPAVKSIQPGLDDVQGLGAQTATAGSTTTVEILAAGQGIASGVEELAATAQNCPQATLTSPSIGTAQVAFAAVDVPDLGDAAAGLSMTISVTGAGGQPVTVPLLLGMARDGDRLVSLTQTDAGGAVDPAAFAGLLQQAFDQQASALD
jgi:hypothetical protein